MYTGQLFIISAPSGAGKTSLVGQLLQQCDDLTLSVSHTTRPKRDQETAGQSYHFVSESDFLRMKSDDAFMESAQVFGHWYGTSQSAVASQLEKGHDVILEIDWQGAEQVMAKMPCVSIFILPPSTAVLRQRLEGRAQDVPEVIERRLSEAQTEMAHYPNYDYVVWNDDFDVALMSLKAIVQACRAKTKRVIARDSAQLKDLVPPQS